VAESGISFANKSAKMALKGGEPTAGLDTGFIVGTEMKGIHIDARVDWTINFA